MKFIPIRTPAYREIEHLMIHKVSMGKTTILTRFDLMDALDEMDLAGAYTCDFVPASFEEDELIFYFTDLTSATIFKLTHG